LPPQPSPPTTKPKPAPKRQKPRKADRDLWVFERQAFGLGYATVAGVDEAGRGPWAGPVVAGAAIMRPYFHCEGIDDSKLLTAEERDHYYDCILEGAEAWGVGIVEVDEIDRVGVSRANRWAMGIAIQQLGRPIDYLLVDGFLLPEALTPQLPIVKGDRRSISIMAGGILAKVTRDRLMARMAEKFPGYGFEMHKGYPTPDHLAAMDRHGLSPLHRRSFISIRTRAELEAVAFASQSARS
jgi:ribonuclease HII